MTKISIFYRCKVEGKYISESASNMPNPDFESDVAKIQNQSGDKLTRSEKLAAKNIKRRQDVYSNNEDMFKSSSNGDDIFVRPPKRQRV